MAELEGRDVHYEYSKAIKRRAGGHEADHGHEDGLPSYILSDSEEGDKWRARHPDNKRVSVVMYLTVVVYCHHGCP